MSGAFFLGFVFCLIFCFMLVYCFGPKCPHCGCLLARDETANNAVNKELVGRCLKCGFRIDV